MATNQDDLLFQSFLQDKGYLDFVGIQPKPPVLVGAGTGRGVMIPRVSAKPFNLQEEMDAQFKGFLTGKGYEVIGELPTKEEGAARLAETEQKLREARIRTAGATIGPISRKKAETAPMVPPSRAAQELGQPTIGPPRTTERPLTYTELAGQKRAEKTKVVYWKEVGSGLDEILSGDGRGWLRILKAGPDDSKRFFGQVLDVLGLVTKGRAKEAAGYLAEHAATGLSLGIINPEVLDKIDQLFLSKGLSSEDYMSMAQRREGVMKELGYYPERPAAAISGVAMVLPIQKVFGVARSVGASASSVPALQRLITAAVGGGATGAAEVAGRKLAGEPLNLKEDLGKIPPHMLYWGLFEFGMLGMETAAKIVNWNLKYAGRIAGTGKTGGYGAAQKIRIETQYAPGRGPTTRTDFTREEIRRLFNEIPGAETAYRTRATSGLATEAERVAAGSRLQDEMRELLRNNPAEYARRVGLEQWKVDVYKAIGDSAGWQEAIRRGWMSPRPIEIAGEPPVIVGRTVHRAGRVAPSVGGEQIPMKPDWGQVLRRGGRPRPWPRPEVVPGASAAPGAATAPPPPSPPGAPPPRPAAEQPAPGAAPPGGPPPAGSAPPAVAGAPRGRAGAPPPPPPRQAPPPQPPPGPTPERPPITPPPPAAAPGEKPPIVPPIESRMPTFEDKVYRGGVEYGEVAGIGETVLKVRKADGTLEYVGQDEFNEGDYSIDQAKKVGINLKRPPRARPQEVAAGWRDESKPIEERIRLANEAAQKAVDERMDLELDVEEGDIPDVETAKRIEFLQQEEIAAENFLRENEPPPPPVAGGPGKQRIKVTPQPDGSFTIESETPPTARPMTGGQSPISQMRARKIEERSFDDLNEAFDAFWDDRSTGDEAIAEAAKQIIKERYGLEPNQKLPKVSREEVASFVKDVERRGREIREKWDAEDRDAVPRPERVRADQKEDWRDESLPRETRADYAGSRAYELKHEVDDISNAYVEKKISWEEARKRLRANRRELRAVSRFLNETEGEANWEDEQVSLKDRIRLAKRKAGDLAAGLKESEISVRKFQELIGDYSEHGIVGDDIDDMTSELEDIKEFLDANGEETPGFEPPKKQIPRTQTALREAIDRIKADQGTPEDVRIVAQAAGRRNERLQKVIEGLKARQHTDLLTGVGSDRALKKQVGWESRPVILFDLAGVKAANNDPNRGYTWTDKNIFEPAGSAFRAFGDDRIYRRGGTADEFPLLSKPGQTLEDLIKDAEVISQELNRRGIEHRWAPGRDFPDAEKRLGVAKGTKPQFAGRPEPEKPAGAPPTGRRPRPGEVDEPWRMTQGEFYESRKSGPFALDPIAAKNIHRASVEEALANGEYVSDEVLKDYPGLESYRAPKKEPPLRQRSSPAEPSQRIRRQFETADDRARRRWRANQRAQLTRRRTGAPKDGPKLWDDILEITGNRGIAPPWVTVNGKKIPASEWIENVPRFLKNRNGMGFDLVSDALQEEPYNYKFGPDDDLWTMLKQSEMDYRAGADFGKAEEVEPPTEYDLDQMDQQHRELRERYRPIINEGESLPDFMARMAKEAEEVGLDPEADLDEFVRAKLAGAKKEPGPGDDETPFLISLVGPKKAAERGLWWSGVATPKGDMVQLTEPSYDLTNEVRDDRRVYLFQSGGGPDVYSTGFIPTWDTAAVAGLPGYKQALLRYTGMTRDPKMREFLDLVERIARETNYYGTGNPQTLSHLPPYAWIAHKHPTFTGRVGILDFQMRYIIATDVAARLIHSTFPAGRRPNLFGAMPIHMKPVQIPNAPPGTIGTIGAFYSPQTGVLGTNPAYFDEKVFQDANRMGAFIRDHLCHEFTHWQEPVHNEAFSSLREAIGDQMAPVWPQIFQLGQQLTGTRAAADRGTVFISLGPGRGQNVDRAVVRVAGEETAKIIAQQKENKGGKEFYSISTKRPPAGGRGGEPGETGLPGARRGAELPYPPEDAPTGRPRPEFGKKPYEWKPPVKGEPTGEFELRPPEEKPPAFKPEDLAAKQKALEMEDAAPLFKGLGGKGDEKALVSVVKRPMPPQPRLPDVGSYLAIRTDDGGIYFHPDYEYGAKEGMITHYELIAKLGIPPERVIGGGYIDDGVYTESPRSEAGQIGRDAREKLGLPREVYASVAIKSGDRPEIVAEVNRLTTGKNFPREWQGNTEVEVEDNRQNVMRFVLENYDPKMGPLENYINSIKGRFIRGEEGRAGKTRLKKEGQLPRTGAGEEVDFPSERSAFAPESQPKHKPPADPEMPGKTVTPNVFGAQEIKVLNVLRSAAQNLNKEMGGTPEDEDILLDILKARLMSDTPETWRAIADRVGKSHETVRQHFNKMLESMKDSETIKELQRRNWKYANLGPMPTERDLERLAKLLRKYFSSYRGADAVIDQMNDRRVGSKIAEMFEQTLDSSVILKWVDKQPPGTEAYVLDLMTGRISGDAYTDIFNSALPFKVKEAALTTRARIDRLSEMIMTHGGLNEETRVAFERNLGKYFTKSYRLFEDKHWSPTEAQKAGFKRWLMNEYNMTGEEAETFLEAELAYGRNDEGARPRRSRRTRRVPTEHYIRRRALSPEWRAFAGEIERVPWLTMHTVTKQATMAFNAQFLDWIKDYLPDHWTASYEEAARRGWQNTQFPAHNYAYGTMAGKFVDPELFQYIKSELDVSRSDIEEAIQKWIMNPFKWTKTIGSYPTHARNFLGNIMFSHILRNNIFNPLNWRWYKAATEIFAQKAGGSREKMAELIKMGVTETQFYGAEIPRMHDDIMRLDPETWIEKLWDAMVKWPIDKAGELYNFEDSLYRVASYLKFTAPESEGGFGMSPEEAVKEINAGMQNYRKLPVIVDVLRRWPVLGPFVSFRWNVGKIVALQAKMGFEETKNPATWARGVGRLIRLATVLAVPFIISEVSKKIFDVSDEDVRELERWYPEYRRHGIFVYFRGKDDKLKIFDLSYLWPSGDFQRFGKALFSGDITGMKDALDFFSHPVFDVWNITIKGQDPQWGMKYRSFMDRAKAAAAYLYVPASMPIPSLEGVVKGDIRPGAFTGPQMKAIIDAYNQQPDKYGRQKNLPEELKNFFTGIRTWDVEPDKLLAQAVIVRNAEIRELQSEYAGWVVRNSKAPEWERENKKKEFLSRVETLTGEIKDIGALSEKLKAGGFKVRGD